MELLSSCFKVHRETKISAIGEVEGSPVGEVWQILPSSQESEEHLLTDQMAQVITTDETPGDGIQQIIYVSYQDPDDPNQSRTLHFGKNEYFFYCIVYSVRKKESLDCIVESFLGDSCNHCYLGCQSLPIRLLPTIVCIL